MSYILVCKDHKLTKIESIDEAQVNGWTIHSGGESGVFFTSETCADVFGPRVYQIQAILELQGMPTTLSARFTGNGTANLKFSNCKPWRYTGGVVTVSLDGNVIQTSRRFGIDTHVNFEYSPGSILTVSTDSFSVVQLKSLELKCGNIYILPDTHISIPIKIRSKG